MVRHHRIRAGRGLTGTLAVSVAREFGITLIGFRRDERFNVDTGSERLLSAGATSFLTIGSPGNDSRSGDPVG